MKERGFRDDEIYLWDRKDIKFFLSKHFLTSLGYHACNLHAKTIRVIPEGVERIQDHIAKGGKVVFACWHQRFFSDFFVPRIFGMKPCIMISQSRDGDQSERGRP